MMHDTVDKGSSDVVASSRRNEDLPALVIAWCAEEPDRVGEIAFFEVDGGASILGRGSGSVDGSDRVVFHRQRPGRLERRPPLSGGGISREQLRIRREGKRLRVTRIGRCPMRTGGERTEACVLGPGDTLLLKGQLLLLCVPRPRKLAPLPSASDDDEGPFGAPDAHGIVGESPAAFRLRDRIAWLASADEHTLLLGGSGSGKELAARAVHARSARAGGPFFARSAATIPAGLIDAELFGNVKGYPNPGMLERPGLIGAAHGGTLFLDEIGELPMSLQANLLRVLDEGGEYHRLGGPVAMRSSFRLIGATNRDPGELKHDLSARLVLRLDLPDLADRREDIPLLARHLIRRAAARSPAAVKRFFAPGSDEPRLKASLVEHILRCRYPTNVRDLDALLWRAMSESEGEAIGWRGGSSSDRISNPGAVDAPSNDLPPGALEATLPLPDDPTGPEAGGGSGQRSGSEPTAAEIRALLKANTGNVVRTAQALGLSRYALYRLLRRHGIEVDGMRGGD